MKESKNNNSGTNIKFIKLIRKKSENLRPQ